VNVNAAANAAGELPVFQQANARANLNRNEGRLNVIPTTNANANSPNLKLEESKNAE
jgi:hypothetical protein